MQPAPAPRRWVDGDGAALSRLSARLVVALVRVDNRQRITLADLERADALARLVLEHAGAARPGAGPSPRVGRPRASSRDACVTPPGVSRRNAHT